MKRQFLAFAILCLANLTQGFAQNGILKGKITDKATGEELIGAAVVIDGTSIGSTTNFSGDYELPPLEPGTYTIRCQYISYEPQLIERVVVKTNEATMLDFKLLSAEMDLAEVKVVAKANRESENLLMLEQKKAAISKETIGAQQMALQGVPDAASGVTKVTGITKQSGPGTINVRGLGDRYNTTTINGLPLPGNHAEYKNIDLELFSTDVIGFIGIEKVFTSGLYADVAGANIDIVSKKQTGDPFFQIDIKTGSNTNLANADKFILQDGPGFLGFNNFSRPDDLKVYDFRNAWNPTGKTPYPNMSFKLKGGRTFTLGEGKLNLFATVSYDNKFQYSNIIQRRINGSDDKRMNLAGEMFKYNTNTTGMLNLNYSKGGSQIYFNSMLLHSSKQDLKQVNGYIIDVVGDPDKDKAFVRRSDFERNRVIVNQLLGRHELNERLMLNWGLAYNTVANVLPDRRHNVLVQENGAAFVPSSNDAANNHRYWHELKEQELAGNINISKTFGEALNEDAAYRAKLTLGYSARIKARDFEAYQYNHSLDKSRVLSIDPNNIDAYFNNERMQAGYFSLKTFFGDLNIPQSYSGNMINHAAFASFEYAVSLRLLAVLGLRFETITQDISYQTSLFNGENAFTENNPFPSLSLKYMLSEKSNLRFAGSMSYTLPQFKETAPFLFEGITDATQGNPYLYPSKVYNADVKWEVFPQAGQLISIAAFGKYIQDPINKFVMASASNDFTYANTGDWAYVLGTELEAKKPVWQTDNKKLVLGANLSLMLSNQELNNEKIQRETKGSINASFATGTEKLQGAAPILGNANLSYISKWKDGENAFSTTFVYGYTSDRLYLIGYAGLGKQVDRSFNELDLIVKSKFDKLGVSFSAKNLLNPNFDRVQENTTATHLVSRYSKGIQLSLGLSYTF